MLWRPACPASGEIPAWLADAPVTAPDMPSPPRCRSRTRRWCRLCPRSLRERGVPDLHRARVAVVHKDVPRRGVEQEMLAGAWRKTDPPRDQNSKHVAMGEQSNVARLGANPGDDAVDPRADLGRALAARTTVPEDHPARLFRMDLLRCERLVLTVVPFLQVGFERCASGGARQLTGLPCSTEGARQDELERLLGQNRTETPRQRPAVRGEGDIVRAGG